MLCGVYLGIFTTEGLDLFVVNLLCFDGPVLVLEGVGQAGSRGRRKRRHSSSFALFGRRHVEGEKGLEGMSV